MSLFYLKEKQRSRLDELKEFRFNSLKELTTWNVKEDITKEEKYPPTNFPEGSTIHLGERWQGRDYYLWLQREVQVPDCDNLYLFLDFGHTGGGYNSGFEALLFIDGKVYQGVDSNHQEVQLRDEFRGCTISVALRLWSGLEGGGEEKVQEHVFRSAQLCQLNKEVDEFVYLGDMIHKTIPLLGENDPLCHVLSSTLDKGLKEIDWSLPKSEDFFGSISAGLKEIKLGLEKLPKDDPITVTAIGHTHIDVAWLWRLKHTREKAARSFSTVLKLMEEYPEYIFLQTQPQLYQYIKEDYPELYEQIKLRIKEGRWEVDGGMWLEADCNIPSGESLTRQLLHGSRFIKEEFNKDIHYLWLPDVFGYSWALPQILRKSGLDTFMTTKISWNQYNRMPHDTFIWRGIDGTEILTHFITTPDADEENEWESNWYYTYNGFLEPETVSGIYKTYRDKNINQHLLISYGYGDGGGGVTRDMLEKRRAMSQIPGLPTVTTGRADDFFRKLHQTFTETDQYIHTWDGELYLEYHRGTYTSQAYVKKVNRKFELALRRLESIFSLIELRDGGIYPKEQLYKMWEVILRNQFHDIIPGSSIKEVYQDHRKEFEKLEHEVEGLLQIVCPMEQKFAIYNAASWERSSLITLPLLPEDQSYADKTGKRLKQQLTDEGLLVLVEDVPAFGTMEIQTVQENNEFISILSGDSGGYENEWYKIAWNKQGHLTSLFDKVSEREVLNGSGNVFQLFEDKPMNFDAWDIDIFYQEKYRELEAYEIEVQQGGEIYDQIFFRYQFGQSKIEQEMRLYHHTKRIDFVTAVDWKERQQLLKVKFDVAIRSTYATYDIQYGNVRRPTNWNTSWEMAKFESVAHQWADLSQRDYGVSLLNDCKYGYDIKDNTLRLSLLKGAIYPDPTADIGHHTFTYSLYPHVGDFIEAGTVKEAWDLNDPFMVVDRDLNLPSIQIEKGEHILVDCLKKSEDDNGWILRFHEYSGGAEDVTIDIEQLDWWQETDLLERPCGDCQSGKIQLTIQPYEIRTIRFGNSKGE
ncbi:TPA: alpha-mannosidase [Streptococcus suis]|nr:alpha-mannosidase [Streptococcus suis]HEM3649038.1 alpha-mannosidase [Streptococcus suis]